MILPSQLRPRTPIDSRSHRGNRSRKPDEVGLDAAARALFEALRSYRLELSRKKGVPPYVVASDRALRELAQLRPKTLDDLQLAHGIGPAKAKKYGAGLLQVVATHRD